jgi:hypothetical protein
MEQSQETTTVVVRSKLIDYLLAQLKMHGIGLALLMLAVWYFHGENIRMQSEIRKCNDSMIEMYRTDRIQLLDVINNNTRALDRIIRQDQERPLIDPRI